MNYKVKMVLPLIGMLLLFGYASLALNELKASPRLKPFTDGKFEASGVAHVPGTDGVLFVDDGRPGEVFWLRLDENGNQAEAIKSISLGVNVIDLEGITNDGSRFYVVGSQSKSKGTDQAGLVRFKFDAQHQRIEETESISGLKKFLAANVAELQGLENRAYKDGGINVEGIAWDARENRWLLGLRSPIVDGQALVVPLRLRTPQGSFTAENLQVVNGKAIRLPLGGAGIRSIEFDDQARGFRLLTGAAMNSEKNSFQLWEWDGKTQSPALRVADSFDRRLKPEGITRATSGNRSFSFIVFDTSGYTALN